MSCTRILIGRIVDGPSRDTIVDVLLDKIFDFTHTAAATEPAIGTLKKAWQRARLELNYSFSSAKGLRHPQLGEWIELSRGAGDGDGSGHKGVAFSGSGNSDGGVRPTSPTSARALAASNFIMAAAASGGSPSNTNAAAVVASPADAAAAAAVAASLLPPSPAVELVRLHATQNISECICTVVVAFLGSESSTTNATVFGRAACDFSDFIDGLEDEDDDNSSGGGVNSLTPHLLASPPNIAAATTSLVSELTTRAQYETLSRNVRAALDCVVSLDCSATAPPPFGLTNKDPWQTLLGTNTVPNPNFACLTGQEVDRIEGTLRPMITQRLGFGSGTAMVTRPLAFPFLQGADNNIFASASSATSPANASSSTNNNNNSQLVFPAVVVVDILGREVTESATVIRDCTEVWCDISRVGRLPAAAAKGNFGRRLAVVGMDWAYVNNATERAAKRYLNATAQQNDSFSAGVRMEESFGETATNNNNNNNRRASAVDLQVAAGTTTSSFYLNLSQKHAFDWSTLRRSHTAIDDAGASQSLPWSSAPPRAIGPALFRRAVLSEFTSIYEAALLRSSRTIFSINPAQLVTLRGLRSVVFAVSPSALRGAGAPVSDTVTALADGESNHEARCRVEIARAGARWTAKRFYAAGGSVNRKSAEKQGDAIKKAPLFTGNTSHLLQGGAAASASSTSAFSGLFDRSNSGGFGAADDVSLLSKPQLAALLDNVPDFKRVARVMSQQPRCILSSQDDSTVGVKCRLAVTPQVLKPVVKHLVGTRRVQIECSLRLGVVFAPPTSFQDSHQQQAAALMMRVHNESLAAFQISDAADLKISSSVTGSGHEIAGGNGGVSGGGAGGNVSASNAAASASASSSSSPPPEAKKVVLERFRVTISGSAYGPHTAPGQSPPARESEACAFAATELKSSVSNAKINTNSSNNTGDISSSTSSSASITWTLPPGTVVNVGEEFSLAGKLLLETVWPDDNTAAAVADAVRNHAAKPFAVPPIHAQLDFVGFIDGDFNADDISLTGSHVDAMTATAIHACVPNENVALQGGVATAAAASGKPGAATAAAFSMNDSFSGSTTGGGIGGGGAAPRRTLLKWRTFAETLRAALQQGAMPRGGNSSNTCLLTVTATEVARHDDGDDSAASASIADSDFAAKATRVETLLPDFASGFATQHLAPALGSQLSEIAQSVFQSSGGGATDVVSAVPKARVIACGPQFGSNFVVWNTAR